MNSEHRHELAQNDLEKMIEQARSKSAVLAEEHGNRILLWASAVLLLTAAFIYYNRTSTTTNADGWSALAGAASPEDLSGIADAYQGTPVGQWAKLNLGEQYLRSGLQAMFTDREAAKTDLTEARTKLEELLNESKLSPEIRERSLYAMARMLEATASEDLQPAIDAYQKLLQEFPETPYKVVVEEQLTALKRKSTQEFYAWFAAQNPKPADLQEPSDLMKGLNLTPPANTDDATSSPIMPTEDADATNSTSGNNPAEQKTKLTVPAAPEFPPINGTEKPEMKGPEATEKSDTEKPAPQQPTADNPAVAPADPADKPADKPAAEPAAETPAEPAPNDGN